MTPAHKAGASAPVHLDHSDSGLSPAQHRSRVAAIVNDRADPVLSWPTLSRLQKAGKMDAVATLLSWRDLTQPPTLGAANDNHIHAETADGVHVERFEDATESMGLDGDWEVRPSVPAMLHAAADIGPFSIPSRVTVTTKRTSAGWTAPKRSLRADNRLCWAPWPQHEYAFFGRLLFGPDGRARLALIGVVERYRDGSWKRPDGRWNITSRPTETWRRNRSAPKEQPQPAPYYLDRKVPVLKGAEFIALAAKSVGAPANDNDAHGDAIRLIECATLRRDLGREDAELLDLAASPMTATQIGQHFGRSPEYARRWAVAAVDAALERLRQALAAQGMPQNRKTAA